MEITLIRHFKTKGNLEKRYIGTTDEHLEPAAVPKEFLPYPEVEFVFSSPLKRCVETAGLIYPDVAVQVLEDLRECDFGLFENKNYEELKDLELYQEWLDSEGRLPIPGAENHEAFCERCVRGFQEGIRLAKAKGYQKIAFTVHGGTIMAIMKAWDQNGKSFYDFQVKNGCGYHLELNGEEQFMNITQI